MRKVIFVHISVIYTHTHHCPMEMNDAGSQPDTVIWKQIKSFPFFLFRLIYLFLKMWNI